MNGESISLRLLSRDQQKAFGFERLDMSPAQTADHEGVARAAKRDCLGDRSDRLGKSTSLYCFLSSINSVQRRIITIEEPVEYRLPGVSQIDVKPEIDLTFAKGLRQSCARIRMSSWSGKFATSRRPISRFAPR